MIQKRILVAERLRRPPPTGWSWLDRRFLREHGDALSRDALLLYLFLSAVADRHGLSFYSDTTLGSRLRLTQPALDQARQELLERDLIAHQLPLVQVLSVPTLGVSRRPEAGQGLIQFGELLRQVGVVSTLEPKQAEPRQAEPRQAEPRQAEPRQAEPRRVVPPPGLRRVMSPTEPKLRRNES